MPDLITIDTEDERVSAAYDYEVECAPLFSDHGPTRFFGTRRKDTGEIFATVTSAYEVLQNRQLVEAAEAAFRTKGMTGWKRKVVVTYGGARCYVIYDFPGIGGKVAGQDLTFRLKIQNSFDGTIRASFVVGLFRLICSNGLAMPVGTLNLTQKHTTALEIDFVGRTVEQALKAFFDALPFFESMTAIRVSQDEGKAIVQGFGERHLLGRRQADAIVRIWEHPRHEEDRARTLWNLYNAVTQHLTHDVASTAKKPRYELAERSTRIITHALVAATQQGRVDLLLPKKK
jgi:hypothetical protein